MVTAAAIASNGSWALLSAECGRRKRWMPLTSLLVAARLVSAGHQPQVSSSLTKTTRDATKTLAALRWWGDPVWDAFEVMSRVVSMGVNNGRTTDPCGGGRGHYLHC